jgi:uncharacterized protein YktA (UPF0223 family)
MRIEKQLEKYFRKRIRAVDFRRDFKRFRARVKAVRGLKKKIVRSVMGVRA